MLSGMQAGVGAVIASVTYDMGAPIVKEKDPMSLVIMLGAFLACMYSGDQCGLHCDRLRTDWFGPDTSSKGGLENDLSAIILSFCK